MSQALVCVVTGASRGVGRGVALALGASGATVYVTGRSVKEGDSPLPGTVGRTAADVTAAGGHGDDVQVAALFERVRREHGRLDILVNCAIAIPDALTVPGPFWQKPLEMTGLLDVGLRSTYVASHCAAGLLIAARGLVVNISSAGSRCYMHGPAYGAGKAGTDKMSFDMAVELREHDVASVSIWPGLILTDELKAVPREYIPQHVLDDLPNFETPEFSGLVIERLWRDPERMARSGETLIAAELGFGYGIRDIDGKQPRLYTDTLGKPSGRFLRAAGRPS